MAISSQPQGVNIGFLTSNHSQSQRAFLGPFRPGRCIVSNRETSRKGWLPNSMYSSRKVFLQIMEVVLNRMFFQINFTYQFMKTNVMAHPSLLGSVHTCTRRSTYINRTYSSRDRTMFHSFLTVCAVIYLWLDAAYDQMWYLKVQITLDAYFVFHDWEGSRRTRLLFMPVRKAIGEWPPMTELTESLWSVVQS